MFYSFENFSLDTARRELRRGGTLIALQPQVFDLIEYLIRNRERVVSKDDLLAAVWNGRIVSESTLGTRINAARSAIGDNGEEQRLLRTAYGKGIRFVGAVREEEEAVGKRAAIFAADVEGYSRLMGQDEIGALRRLTACRAILDERIAAYRGWIFGSAGGSVVADFASAVDAVQCAVAVQEALAKDSAARPPGEQMRFRIGVHVGDVIVQGENLFGDGVYIAARLKALAEPGGICISGAVRDQISTKLPVAFSDLGEQQVKNTPQPIRAYRVRGEATIGVTATPPPLPDKPSIAVLSFTNMSGDPEQEYFADGMVEDLITNLSRLRWLFVVARNSCFTYKGRAVDIRRIAEDLGVRYVLEGSVRRVGNRVRVTAQLIEAESGRHLWAERYDREVEDIFAMQDEITDRIAATLEPEISAAERERARRKPPTHLGSWELYQRGMWHLLRRNREDFTAARRLFGQAIELDPNFAPAHAAFAVSEFWQITHGFAEDPDATRAGLLASASRAVELDPRDSLAHSAMGLAFMEGREHTKAIAEHKSATALNPNSSFGQWCFGYALNFAGRPSEALPKFDLALRLSPRDPAAWSYLTLRASALYQLKRYEEAAQAAEDAMRTQLVDLVWPLVHRSAALGQMGRRQAVINELRRRRPALSIRTFCAWPHNQGRTVRSLEHIVEGLRKAGLPQ